MNGKSLTHDGGESYCGIGSTKQPNKSGKTPAEAVEKRPQTKENTQQPNWAGLRAGKAGQTGWSVCAKQQERIRS